MSTYSYDFAESGGAEENTNDPLQLVSLADGRLIVNLNTGVATTDGQSAYMTPAEREQLRLLAAR